MFDQLPQLLEERGHKPWGSRSLTGFPFELPEHVPVAILTGQEHGLVVAGLER